MQPQELLKRMKSIEFRSGHIPGSIHAPTWKILLRLARIPVDRNAELVVTCELGPLAQLAKGLLGAFGYRHVALLSGHMAGWRRTGGVWSGENSIRQRRHRALRQKGEIPWR